MHPRELVRDGGQLGTTNGIFKNHYISIGNRTRWNSYDTLGRNERLRQGERQERCETVDGPFSTFHRDPPSVVLPVIEASTKQCRPRSRARAPESLLGTVPGR